MAISPMNSAAAAYLQPDAIRAGLSRRKMLDKVFVVVGLVLMLACLGILAVLFLDLVIDGSARFGWDFFTNFPSRRAERAPRSHPDEFPQSPVRGVRGGPRQAPLRRHEGVR